MRTKLSLLLFALLSVPAAASTPTWFDVKPKESCFTLEPVPLVPGKVWVKFNHRVYGEGSVTLSTVPSPSPFFWKVAASAICRVWATDGARGAGYIYLKDNNVEKEYAFIDANDGWPASEPELPNVVVSWELLVPKTGSHHIEFYGIFRCDHDDGGFENYGWYLDLNLSP